MKTAIIFHSYTGITRGIAEEIQAGCRGDLIEVKPRQDYTKLTAYTIGCLRARRGEGDPTDPRSIDVSPYDLIVIGTPVWAWKPTPVTNAAIRALRGCEGKPAVIFATCGGQAGDTLDVMRKELEAKGVCVQGESALTRKDCADPQKVAALIDLVKQAMVP
ncbi:MAG: ArsR family transcriptional regulator [Methanoregulaceae archaeon]|nr:ArsR family transcriptional regulator [Methanoregulaceae archaeon]